MKKETMFYVLAVASVVLIAAYQLHKKEEVKKV